MAINGRILLRTRMFTGLCRFLSVIAGYYESLMCNSTTGCLAVCVLCSFATILRKVALRQTLFVYLHQARRLLVVKCLLR